MITKDKVAKEVYKELNNFKDKINISNNKVKVLEKKIVLNKKLQNEKVKYLKNTFQYSNLQEKNNYVIDKLEIVKHNTKEYIKNNNILIKKIKRVKKKYNKLFNNTNI